MAANGNLSGDQPDIKKMGFFDSVLAPPEWLNHSYVENVLRDHEKDPELTLTNYTTSTCTKPGDNFVGVIFRSAVSYTTHGSEKKDSLIFKIEPFMEGFKKDIMANQPFFNTEGRMYTEMLPLMQDLLKNSGDPEIIAPGLIHYGANPNILIFKDISPEGFVMQHMPIPFDKTAMIATKLAKFHAVGFYLKDQEQGEGLVTSFEDGFFGEKLIANWDFLASNIDALIEITSGWGDEMLQVSKKLVALKPHFTNKMKEVYKPSPNGINFLNHGDFHIRNLLFRYSEADSSKFEAIQFIDFQLSVYATPAIDLSYLIYLIADTDTREKHRNQLLKTYHDQLIETLNGLGFQGKAPSLLDIHLELMRNGIMEFCVASSFLTMYYMDYSKFADIDFTKKSEMTQIAKSMYEGETLKGILMRILPDLMYRGILDV